MEKCPVCGNRDYIGFVCPDCGFDESRNYQKYPSLESVSSSKSVAALQEAWKTKQKLRYRSGLRISIEAPYFSYDEESKQLAYDHSEEIPILNGNQLAENEIIWSDAEFIRMEGIRQLPVRLLVENGSGRRAYRVTVYNPEGDGQWQVGIKLSTTSSMDAQLAVGGPQRYELSESFTLKF